MGDLLASAFILIIIFLADCIAVEVGCASATKIRSHDEVLVALNAPAM